MNPDDLEMRKLSFYFSQCLKAKLFCPFKIIDRIGFA
jgi:hypothetical protein